MESEKVRVVGEKVSIEKTGDLKDSMHEIEIVDAIRTLKKKKAFGVDVIRMRRGSMQTTTWLKY